MKELIAKAIAAIAAVILAYLFGTGDAQNAISKGVKGIFPRESVKQVLIIDVPQNQVATRPRIQNYRQFIDDVMSGGYENDLNVADICDVFYDNEDTPAMMEFDA